MKKYTLIVREVAHLFYTVEAESPEEATEFYDECETLSDLGECEEEIIEHELLDVRDASDTADHILGLD